MQLSALEGHLDRSYNNWKVVYKHVHDAYWKLGDVERSFDELKSEFQKTSSASNGGITDQS